MIEVDIHLHTDFSSCANLSLDRLVAVCRENARTIVTATDHGSVEACKKLRELLPDRLVVFGIEVTCQEGDFLVFSDDEAYLASLSDYPPTVKELRRDEQTAVIWAHPRVSQRAHSWEAPKLDDVRQVVPHIDGLEVYNGTMLSLHREGVLSRKYFANLVRIALEYSLAMTGGSDAHDEEMLFHCGTKFPKGTGNSPDFVRAIKERKVMPVYDHRFFGVHVSLGG